MRVKVQGRARSWYDESKAQTWAVQDGETLALTAAGEWMLRPADVSDEASPVDRDQARDMLAAAGLSTAPADRWVPPEPRRSGRPGRPQVGTKVDVRLPDEMLAAVDAIAADGGATRSDVIRSAVADRVEMRTRGVDRWLRTMSERAPFADVSAASELGSWRYAQLLELQRAQFTVAELCCVADVLNGAFVSPGFGRLVAGELSDAFGDADGQSSYGAKWGVDEDALVAKLAGLGPVTDYALRQAVAEFWSTPDADSSDPGMWVELGFDVEP